MNDFPFAYDRIAPTTWAYLSSLLMLALFFKFNRFWSIRNFDLILIILLAPGILIIESGRMIDEDNRKSKQKTEIQQPLEDEPGSSPETSTPVAGPNIGQADEDSDLEAESGVELEPDPATPLAEEQLTRGQVLQKWGYYWLFGVGAVFLVRLLIDPALLRKPLLEPNLSIGGTVFLGCSLMIFLFANIITSNPTKEDIAGAQSADKLLKREIAQEDEQQQLIKRGPGYALFNLLPIIPTYGRNSEELLQSDDEGVKSLVRHIVAAKSLAITSQVFIVLGLVFIGIYHFKSFNTGAGMATIYLMLPYTAMYTGHVLHTLPAALLVWAIVCFRRPILAGTFIGLATGVSYYPLFLLPLWLSFYWEKGLGRFLIGFFISIAVCIAGLMFTSGDASEFFGQLQVMFGFWWPLTEGLEGIWGLGWDRWYRLPIVAAFIAFSVSFAFWPGKKNLGTLMSYTGALMVAVQFWHGFGGGLYMAWFLPMVLMAIFRPNMDGRVAKTELAKVEPQLGL